MSGWIWIVLGLVLAGYLAGIATWLACDPRWREWLS